MAKELRMTATVGLPDNAFKQSAILGKIDPAREEFEKALSAAAGGKVEVEARIVTSQGKIKRGESTAPAGLELAPAESTQAAASEPADSDADPMVGSMGQPLPETAPAHDTVSQPQGKKHGR